jgi:hypothetical protein
VRRERAARVTHGGTGRELRELTEAPHAGSIEAASCDECARAWHARRSRSSTMRSAVVTCSSLLAALALSCTQAAHPTPSSSSAARTAEAELRAMRPTAPAGRTFDAILDVPLSSLNVEPGDAVLAHLAEPLIGGDGRVVVSRGTPIVGKVLSVQRVGANRITLQLDHLLVKGRDVPIDSRVRWAERSLVTHPAPAGPDAAVANLYALSPEPTAAPIGGGPPAMPLPLELPRGAKVQLVLLQPFSMPDEPAREPLE